VKLASVRYWSGETFLAGTQEGALQFNARIQEKENES